MNRGLTAPVRLLLAFLFTPFSTPPPPLLRKDHMNRLLKRFGLAGLIFFTVKGLAWLALAGTAGYISL